MSNFGFLRLPRSLREDPLWIGFTQRERHAYEEFLYRMAYEETSQDDHGQVTVIKIGQYLTTEREFADLCNLTKPKGMERFDKSFINRLWVKLKRLDFSDHKVNHKKTILTCTRKDICKLIEPGIEPKVNQERTKSEPQKKNDKKDDNEKKFKKSDIAADCSYVHNSDVSSENDSSRSCEHAKQSKSLLFDIENFSPFDIASYRFPDGSPISLRMQQAIAKSQDGYHEKFMRNLILCQERWEEGKKPKSGNTYEQMLQGFMNKDIAGQQNHKERNRIYAKFIAREHPDLKLKALTSVMQLKGETISYELPESTIEGILEEAIENLHARR
jgi:hypothetical protein